MNADLRDARVESASLVLERNRAELRAVLEPDAPEVRDRFPRSATVRWIIGHLSPRSLAMTALTAAIARVPFGRLLGGALFGRRH